MMRFTNAQFAATCNGASQLTDTTIAVSAGPYGGTSLTSANPPTLSLGDCLPLIREPKTVLMTDPFERHEYFFRINSGTELPTNYRESNQNRSQSKETIERTFGAPMMLRTRK